MTSSFDDRVSPPRSAGHRDMQAPAQIDTPRLRLSRPTDQDAEEIFERYATDPDVTRFVCWPRHRSLADTRAFLGLSASEWEHKTGGPYLIRARADGQLLGSTGLGYSTPTTAVTGYILAKDAWGRGYATETLAAMVQLARRTGVTQLSAYVHHQHQPSCHVLEKCGFARDATVSPQMLFPNLTPAGLHDVLRYVLPMDSPSRAGAPTP
jgi:RimJ/RimL family protein N-acetyltransferase